MFSHEKIYNFGTVLEHQMPLGILCRREQVMSVWNFALKFPAVAPNMACNFMVYFFAAPGKIPTVVVFWIADLRNLLSNVEYNADSYGSESLRPFWSPSSYIPPRKRSVLTFSVHFRVSLLTRWFEKLKARAYRRPGYFFHMNLYCMHFTCIHIAIHIAVWMKSRTQNENSDATLCCSDFLNLRVKFPLEENFRTRDLEWALAVTESFEWI